MRAYSRPASTLWEILDGPEVVTQPTPGTRAWTWRLCPLPDEPDDEGDEHQQADNRAGAAAGERELLTVEVVVSELALDSPHARAAAGSSGRVAVEGVLDWRQPPTRILCTLVGFVCEGGRQQ